MTSIRTEAEELAMQEKIEAISEEYADLLILQYRGKPKARATIKTLIKHALLDGIMFDLEYILNIEKAKGFWLDIVGRIVGVDRSYPGVDWNRGVFFSLGGAAVINDSNCEGFRRYGEVKEGTFVNSKDTLGSTVALDDDNYRDLIKLKIAQNNSNHSVTGIQKILYRFFGDRIIFTKDAPMSMVYFIEPDRTALLVRVAAQKDVLPRPLCVDLKYVISGTTFFSFGGTNVINDKTCEGFRRYGEVRNGQFLTSESILKV
jgi:hypothetical protein